MHLKQSLHKEDFSSNIQEYPRIKQDFNPSVPEHELYVGYKEKLEKLSRKELDSCPESNERDIKPTLSSHSEFSHQITEFSRSNHNHYSQELSNHSLTQSHPGYQRVQATQLHQQQRMSSTNLGSEQSNHQLPSTEEDLCRFRQTNIAEEHYRRFLAANMERAGIWSPQHQLKTQHSN